MSLARSTRARLTTAIILVLVLGAGVVSGMALDRGLQERSRTAEGFRRSGGRSGMDGRSRGFESRPGEPPRDPSRPGDSLQPRPPLIVEQVGLSEEQRMQADSIFWFYRSQMRVLHEEFDSAYTSRYRGIMAESREAMLGILTEEQRVRYDSLLVEMSRRRQERRQDSVSGSGGQPGGH